MRVWMDDGMDSYRNGACANHATRSVFFNSISRPLWPGGGGEPTASHKQTTSQPVGSQPAGSGQRTGSSDGRAWSGWDWDSDWDSEISGGSENPSFAPNAVHGLGLGFGVSPHVSLW